MDNQELRLTVKQVTRYEMCTKVLDGPITNKAAAEGLRLSVRQIQRVKRPIEKEGFKGVVHGNTGREPPNKTPGAVRDKVLELAENGYSAYNFSHLADTLAEEHEICLSDETLRLWLLVLAVTVGRGDGGANIVVGANGRAVRSRCSSSMAARISGSVMRSLPATRLAWLLAGDDATGKPLWGKFQPQENRDGCFEVCYHVFNPKPAVERGADAQLIQPSGLTQKPQLTHRVNLHFCASPSS